MEKPAGTSKKTLLRRLRKYGFWLVVLVLILIVGSNLWLSSPWGTAMVAAKMKQRTGLDWEIGSATWSPWGGVTLKDVVSPQPEGLTEENGHPLLRVDSIVVQPNWQRLLQGKIRPREIVVDSPDAHIPVELLASLAANFKTPPQQPMPTRPSAPVEIHRPHPEEKNPSPTPETKPQPAPHEAIAHNPRKENPPQPAETPATTQSPILLRVNNAKLVLFSSDKNVRLLKADGLDVTLPMLGPDAEGEILCKSLAIPGVPKLENLQQKVVWKHPFLELPAQELTLGGLKCRMIAQLGIGGVQRSRLPFLFDCVIDQQPWDSGDLLDRLAMKMKVDRVIGRARVSGFLVKPLTWRGDAQLRAQNLRLSERHGGRQLHFDHVNIPTVFRNGSLIWGGVRCVGEELSVMGNGSLSPSAGVLCITRIVASPEAAKGLERGIRGAHLIGNDEHWFSNLQTPDRVYRDVLVHGPLLDSWVDAKGDHSDVSALQLASVIFDFIRTEMREEGRELAPVPNAALLNR